MGATAIVTARRIVIPPPQESPREEIKKGSDGRSAGRIDQDFDASTEDAPPPPSQYECHLPRCGSLDYMSLTLRPSAACRERRGEGCRADGLSAEAMIGMAYIYDDLVLVVAEMHGGN